MTASGAGRSGRQGAFELAGRFLLLVVLYVLSGRLGLRLAYVEAEATLFWPPTGLSLAALLLYGRRMWPGVFVGAMVLNAWNGSGPLVAMGISVGNTLEAVVGALLLQRVAGFRATLERVRDVLAFLLFGALACTLVSATIGVSVLALAGELEQGGFGAAWRTWWLGDIGGAVVVAPPLLVSRYGTPPWRELLRRGEAWLVLALVVASSLLAFGGLLAGPWALLAAFVPFPFLVWSGGRLGPRGAVLGAFGVSLAAVVGTALGRGPFAVAESEHAGFMLVWSYALTLGAVGMILAAAVAEREMSESRRSSEEDSRLELERRIHQAQRLESLGLLAGGIAHDFNNILTAIRGNAELLGTQVGNDPALRERLDQIEKASDRAADLCRRLLAYAGRRRPDKKVLSLAQLVEETCELVKPSIPLKIDLDLSVSDDTPALEGDSTLLRQVVMNLVLNGAEAIGEGAGAIEVETGALELDARTLARLVGGSEATPGRFAYVEVRDTGKGMDAHTRERIFDPFYSTKNEGRGLGLASVLGIVQTHGGAIEVRSAPARGASFRVLLPSSTSEPDRESPSTWIRRTRGAGRSVLVADDEPAVLGFATQVLESAGYQVVQAHDGNEALELYSGRSGELNAALLDVTMPGLSGLEVLARIRAEGGRLPVVLMTGYEPPTGPEAPEPDAILRKPFSSRDLLDRLGHALARP
jgi:signal transduction histidine kinase/CheY-like chemotaxis protein